MDVELKPVGCVERFAVLASFGLVALATAKQRRQLPRSLTDQEMVLRDGTRIPWKDFQRFQATDLRVQGVHMAMQYTLWHGGGKVVIMSNKVVNPDGVMAFITARLPKDIQQG